MKNVFSNVLTLVVLWLAMLIIAPASYAESLVSGPIGYTKYCSTHFQLPECGNVNNIVDSTQAFHTTSWLSQINQHVNEKMAYQNDVITYGKDDVWANPVNNVGDCEDYALKKMHILYSSGWKTSELRIALVNIYGNGTKSYSTYSNQDSRQASHAVLLATLNGVDYVLDSKQDYLLSVDDYKEGFGVQFLLVQTGNGKWTTWTN